MKGVERDQLLVQELVKFTGMTPAAVARAAGVAVTTINRPFRGTGTTRLSQPTLDKLRTRFPHFEGWGDYLGAASQSSDAVETAYSGEELGWLDLLLRLSASDRGLVLQLARRLDGERPRELPPTLHDNTVDFWAKKHEQRGS